MALEAALSIHSGFLGKAPYTFLREIQIMKKSYVFTLAMLFSFGFLGTAFAAGAPCDAWDCNEPNFVKCDPQECCCAAKTEAGATKAAAGDIKGWNKGTAVKYAPMKK